MVTKTRIFDESRAEGRDSGSLRWSVERRLAFIEERLFWLGEVNRTDLVRRFGVSMSQASADIARYLARDPTGVIYDKSAKRYTAQTDFRPLLAKPNATRFLGELRLVEVGLLSVEDTMLGVVPHFDATPVPERRIDPLVLRAVLFAMRGRESLDVAYQSMSRPEVARRVIEPHALAYDGFRWHTRAFDRESGEFRDFVLGRLSKPKARAKANSMPENDIEWQTFVDLIIAPHAGLTPAQSKAIAIDYGIRGSSISIRVRRALLFYALKRLGLDIAPGVRPANEQHITLLNRDEVLAAPNLRTET
jgi:hypothetical protein